MPEPHRFFLKYSRTITCLSIIALAALIVLWWCYQERQLKIALVYSVGGVDDNPFNSAARDGIIAVENLYDVSVDVAIPNNGADIKRFLNDFAEEGYDVVVGVGFLAYDPIVAASYRNRGAQFALLDGPPELERDNIWVATFQHNGGGFLAGATAANASGADNVGFIGGMDVPVIREFRQGFIDGVRAVPEWSGAQVIDLAEPPHVLPTGKLIWTAYISNDPDGFSDPAAARELGEAMIARGCDVIFPAAGASSQGIIELAAEKRCCAIGIDGNQDRDAPPGWILTSVMKRMDRPLVRLVEALVVTGRFPEDNRGGYDKRWIMLSNESRVDSGLIRQAENIDRRLAEE